MTEMTRAEILTQLLTPPQTMRPGDRLTRLLQQVRAYKNWAECLRIRKVTHSVSGAHLTVQFRDGFSMIIRDGTNDILILWEVLLSGAYASTDRLVQNAALKNAGGACSVIDLGTHIGTFTLRCARLPGVAAVHSYEPGPDNRALLEENLAKHPALAKKVQVFAEAAGAETGEAFYHLDVDNAGASTVSAGGGEVPVPVRAFREIVARCPRPIAFVKIDIEGGEYAVLRGSTPEDWADIPAVMAELHDDPLGQSTPAAWLDGMAALGFTQQTREFTTVVLERPAGSAA